MGMKLTQGKAARRPRKGEQPLGSFLSMWIQVWLMIMLDS